VGITRLWFSRVDSAQLCDIFFNNCFKNGILPIVLDTAIVERLFQETYASEGYRLTIDLHAQTVATPMGETFASMSTASASTACCTVSDDIGLSLQHRAEISAYESGGVTRRRGYVNLTASTTEDTGEE